MTPVLVTEGLGHDYGSRRALDDVSLELGGGELVALLGPNGGGKSTLFRIVATILRPARGAARVSGHDVLRDPAAARRSLGVAFQSPSVDGKLTVRENMMHQGHLVGLSGAELKRRTEPLLADFGLADRRDDRVETLSGGLARRVDVAKALLHRPPLLLLDEPSTGLDPSARRDLLRLLRRIRDEHGTTCFLTTHLFEEAEQCDRVAILDRGRLVADGRTADLVRSIGGEVVTLETAGDAAALAEEIRERFGVEPKAVDGEVRIERENGAELLPQLVAAFADRVRTASVARPGLADVFFHRAGRVWEEDEAAGQPVATEGARDA
jgi:ABC-2 type transport system ATP-binding protein